MILVVGMTTFAQTKFRALSWKEAKRRSGKVNWCLLISIRIGVDLVK